MSCADVQTIQAGNGSKTQFSFDFPYLFKTEIEVSFWNATTKEWDVKATTDATYPWQVTDANPTIVEFTSTAPPSPTTPTDPGEPTVDNVRIRRVTNIDDIRALFSPGSAIRSDDLNKNFEQLRYAIQEAGCQGIPEDIQDYLENYYWDRFNNTIYEADAWVSDDTKIATTAAMDARFQDEVAETIRSDETWVENDDTIPTTLAAAVQFDTLVQTGIPSGSGYPVGKTWLQNDTEKTVSIWDGAAWVAIASGGAFTTLPKVVYVDAVNGNDSLQGHRISNPKRTIKAAIEQINAETDEIGDGSVVIVAPGVYQEIAPIDIQKKNVSIIGQALRSCIVHPTPATEENTLFRLNTGSYVANLTLTGVKASGTRGGNSLDTDATYGLPTNQGWNFAFYPGATIVKSPYIANCTNFSDSEIDNSDLNAFNPRGGLGGDTDSAPTGGGILIDGSVVSSSSPLRSMVCDSYTHVGLDGPGIFVTNNGYCQATSSYAFFTHYHIKTLNGGQANLAASTSDFGRYGLIASGKSSTNIFTASSVGTTAQNSTTITIGAPSADSSWHGSATRPQSNMLLQVGGNADGTGGTIYSIIGSTANGSGWDVEISNPDPTNLSNNLGFSSAVPGSTTIRFFLRSMIASSGHTMEYVGSGTNYSALPENGGVPIEANEIVNLNNGKVWAATTNHQGKFTVGDTFNVDQVTGYVNIANGAIGIEQLIEDLDLNSYTLSDSTGDVTIDDQLDMNTHKIVNVVDPTSAQDASTKAYTDTKLPLAGGTMTGNIVMSGTETVDGRDLSVDGAKLDGIEAGADVTDAANVDAAGAVMNSDTTTASMAFVVDEDNMTSDSATKIPTQQSVKAYADTKLPLAGGTMTGNLTMNAQSDVRFADSDSSNYVAIQGPATIGTNYTLTLPNTTGNAGEALITDANGNLSWSSSIGTVVDQIIEGDTKVEAVDTGSNGELQFTTDGTRAMTIDNNQQVDISQAGTAASPALIFNSDTNTGIYSPGADQVAISTGGTDALFINSSGQIGIGGATAAVPLQINSSNTNIYTLFDDGTNARVQIQADTNKTTLASFTTGAAAFEDIELRAAQHIFSRSGSSESARIDSSGRLGLGTSSPSELLHVSGGNIRLSGSAGVAQTVFREINFNNSSTTISPGVKIVATTGGNTSDHELAFYTTTDNAVNTTEKVRISHNGNVGIGTTSPAGTLNIEGSTGAPSLTYNTADVVNLDAGSIQLAIGVNSSAPFGAYLQGRATNNTSRVISLNPAGGDVGVGTASPAVALHVATTGTPQFRLEDLDIANAYSNVSANNGHFVIQADPENVIGSTRIGFEIDGSESARIDSSGRLGLGTSSPDTILDVRDGNFSSNQDFGIQIGTPGGQWKGGLKIKSDGSGNNRLAIDSPSDNSGGALEALSIRPNGNVGIGTTSPGSLLEVSSSGSSDETIADFGNSVISGGLQIQTNGNLDWGFNARNSRNLTFSTNQLERARLDSSGKLLVGTTTSRSVSNLIPALQLEGTTGNEASLSITRNSNIENPPFLVLGKSRGTANGDSTIVQANDILGEIRFAGADGVNLGSIAASVSAYVDGAPGANDMPGMIVLSTTAGGASSPTERLRIASTGAVGLSGANYGTAGQVLTSNGSGSAPTWENTGTPAGTVIYYAASTAPTGYLKANGATVSRTTYADLFAAIGTTFGAGDGSTTFKLPDLRGEFIRGYHDGDAADPDYVTRTFGSFQNDAFESHLHNYYNTASDNIAGSGDNRTYITVAGTGSQTQPTGGAETRPRNVALLACIRY
jgi:microcystin-dependent protein